MLENGRKCKIAYFRSSYKLQNQYKWLIKLKTHPFPQLLIFFFFFFKIKKKPCRRMPLKINWVEMSTFAL